MANALCMQLIFEVRSVTLDAPKWRSSELIIHWSPLTFEILLMYPGARNRPTDYEGSLSFDLGVGIVPPLEGNASDKSRKSHRGRHRWSCCGKGRCQFKGESLALPTKNMRITSKKNRHHREFEGLACNEAPQHQAIRNPVDEE